MTFNIQPLSTFVLLVFHENGIIRSFHPLKIYQNTKFMVPRNFFVHLRSLNVRHFGMVEATGLETMASRSPSVA
jgi:hypothetical protein